MKKFFQRGGFTPLVALFLGASAGATRADSYSGNGNTGFGGPVGGGSLTITNGFDASNGNVPDVTFSFSASSNHPQLDGNDLVVYVSTGAPGLSDTSTLTDNGDAGRTSISGYVADNSSDGNVPTRTLVTFPTGFQATYALSFQDTYVGLFHLVNLTSPPALDYVTGASQTNEPDTVTIDLSQLGLTPGQSFQFVGSDIATSTYRSNEAIGPSNAPADPNNLGYTGELDFSGSDSFSTPEPGSLGVLALSGIVAMRGRKRKVSSVA